MKKQWFKFSHQFFQRPKVSCLNLEHIFFLSLKCIISPVNYKIGQIKYALPKCVSGVLLVGRKKDFPRSQHAIFFTDQFPVVSVSGVWCTCTVLISYTGCCHFTRDMKYDLYQNNCLVFVVFFIYNLVIKLSFAALYYWSHSKEIVWFVVYKLVLRCVLHFCFPVFSQLLSVIMIVKELKFCCIWFHFGLRSW